jgi:hypothetical protein
MYTEANNLNLSIPVRSKLVSYSDKITTSYLKLGISNRDSQLTYYYLFYKLYTLLQKSDLDFAVDPINFETKYIKNIRDYDTIFDIICKDLNLIL